MMPGASRRTSAASVGHDGVPMIPVTASAALRAGIAIRPRTLRGATFSRDGSCAMGAIAEGTYPWLGEDELKDEVGHMPTLYPALYRVVECPAIHCSAPRVGRWRSTVRAMLVHLVDRELWDRLDCADWLEQTEKEDATCSRS